MEKVFLVDYTPKPEKVVAIAAKLCYSNTRISEIYSTLRNSDCGGFIKKLVEMGHESPLEHVSFTFGIEGVSRVMLAQLTRHRIASYSVKSQRYVEQKNFQFVVPPQIRKNPEAKDIYETALRNSLDSYSKIIKVLGNEEKDTKKIIEDARYVLSQSVVTNIICTFNARSLLNLFSLRCCRRAQWEIRNVANQMLELVKGVAPNIFAYAGPPCVKGECNQGKLSCGRKVVG